MKPGLAVLPLEVWTDVFVYSWIARQKMAQIVDRIGNRKFAEKLQFRLHDYGKQSLRYLQISSKFSDKPKYELRKRKIFECRASLSVAPCDYFIDGQLVYADCEFPETEMPENITKFKELSIQYFDEEALDFLAKIKPLLSNVFLSIYSIEQAKNVRILFNHLLPMLASIRAISCDGDTVEFLEQHFPGTLALTKEFHLLASMDFIPTYLNWLNAPHDFILYGPRFLIVASEPETIIDIVDAVRKQFQSATNSATFVIFLEFEFDEHLNAEEFNIENGTTNEQLEIRNAQFERPTNGRTIHYVEVLRHPTGASAKVREWLKQRAYYEKIYVNDNYDEERTVTIGDPSLTIGHISKKAKAMKHAGKLANVQKDEAGPSTSAIK